jgi:hypothetical protein
VLRLLPLARGSPSHAPPLYPSSPSHGLNHGSGESRKRMEATQAVRLHARKPHASVEKAIRVSMSLRFGASTLSVASWIPTEPRLLV